MSLSEVLNQKFGFREVLNFFLSKLEVLNLTSVTASKLEFGHFKNILKTLKLAATNVASKTSRLISSDSKLR